MRTEGDQLFLRLDKLDRKLTTLLAQQERLLLLAGDCQTSGKIVDAFIEEVLTADGVNPFAD